MKIHIIKGKKDDVFYKEYTGHISTECSEEEKYKYGVEYKVDMRGVKVIYLHKRGAEDTKNILYCVSNCIEPEDCSGLKLFMKEENADQYIRNQFKAYDKTK